MRRFLRVAEDFFLDYNRTLFSFKISVFLREGGEAAKKTGKDVKTT